jgi:hypothetical protein
MQSKAPFESRLFSLENKNGLREYWPILNRDKIKVIQEQIGVDYAEPKKLLARFYRSITTSVDQCVCFVDKCIKSEAKKKQKATKGEIILLFALILVLWMFIGIEVAAITSLLGIVTSLLMHSRK